MKLIKKRIQEQPSITAVKLKRSIHALANVSIRAIQNCCLNDFKLPSRAKAQKPLITSSMKEQRLNFDREHVN